MSQDSEIESYARQIAEVASVSFASDLCFKRRRLILANLNIVLEEYLSVVIFDISHSKFVFRLRRMLCILFYVYITLLVHVTVSLQ